MKNSKTMKGLALLIMVLMLLVTLFACQPYTGAKGDDPFDIEDGKNEGNIDKTTKDDTIKKVTDGIDNLLEHLDSEDSSETGYYFGANAVINADNHSAFRLVIRANMYTYPYVDKDGNIDETALAKHNELIKNNDMIIEWYDATKNEILIGFYYDGINANSADRGNNLYLNLQGSKRIFPKFGDSVLYQQIVRLITKFNLDSFLGDMSDGGTGGTVSTLKFFLEQAITDNYKQVVNGDVTSVYYNSVDLAVVKDKVSDTIRGLFSPFSDKLDPLTEKYLGFSFSTLGEMSFSTLGSDLQFFTTPDEILKKDIMTGVAADLRGISRVRQGNKDVNIPFTSRMTFDYNTRPAGDIIIEKLGYKLYEYGQYEFTGDLYIPALNLQLDGLIRTNINEDHNEKNEVFSQFRDKADNSLIIGAYYKNEKAYIDVEGLQRLYGGIKLSDIGLPKAYMSGFNLSALMKEMFDMLDKQIIIMVDGLLAGQDGGDQSSDMLNTIMKKVESTKKDPNIPESRNTVAITIDLELIKFMIKQNSESNTEVTTAQVVDILESRLGIDLRAIAKIFGMSVEELLDTTYVKLTLDVDSNDIKIEVKSYVEEGEDPLLLRLNLTPVKIGETVKIAFPDFTSFKPMKQIMTYSGYIEGQFLFNDKEEVDFSALLGAMMGDLSGKNTPFILPNSAELQFRMWYDQYIREQTLEDGRWVRTGRSAFKIEFYMKIKNTETALFSLYANDIGFDTSLPIEEQGYIWVDLKVLAGTPYEIPKFQIREDLFIYSMASYMGYDWDEGTGIVIGLTDILQVLLEDSIVIFSEEAISITTSNKTIKNLFKVDDMVLTADIQIGFVQRVKGIDEIQKDFARYTVMGFANIKAPNPYAAKLHEKIEVKFDFGNRIETKTLFVDYDPLSIEVVTGKKAYNPMLNGKFMGVQRSYQVDITGGSVGAAKILKLDIPTGGFVVEPLSQKLDEAKVDIGNGNVVTYAADFKFGFDWKDITLEGGVFNVKVVIGEGMMATYSEDVTVKVTNRKVQTDKFVTINTAKGLVRAPIAATIKIDPYLYILEKGMFVKNGNEPNDFVKFFFSKYNIDIAFGGDTGTVSGKYNTFSFDFNNSNSMYIESDIHNKVTEGSIGISYISMVYNGQVIAVELQIMSKTIDHIVFDGEKENGIYTVDSLLESTHTIPKNPIIHFKEALDGQAKYIDFSAYGVFLKWTNPIANNLKLVGNNKPFLETDGMKTSAYLDIMGSIDPHGAFLWEDYFINPLITVQLSIPDKVVQEIDHQVPGTDALQGSDISVKGSGATTYELINNEMVEREATNGIYYYDPFRPSTANLPTTVRVRFFNESGDAANKYYEKDYDVTYHISDEIEYNGGKPIIKAGATKNYFTALLEIGNEKVGKLQLKLVVCTLSTEIKGYTYLDEEKNIISGSYDESATVREITVDTFKGFELPKYKFVLTTDGFARLYENNFEKHTLWIPGQSYNIADNDLVFGQGGRQMKVTVTDNKVTDIEFLNNTNKANIAVDKENKTITISGLAFVGNNIFDMAPFDFLRNLMANLTLTLSNDETVTRNNYEMFNYDRIFDTTLWKEKGGEFVLMLGQGKGSYDYTVKVIASNPPIVTEGKGANSISGAGVVEEMLSLFNDDNTEKYPNGYVINDNLTVNITYSNGTIVQYGYNTPYALTKWTIEQTKNPALAEGQIISSIPKDILTEGLSLVISTILPNGVKVFRTISILRLGSDFKVSSVGSNLYDIVENVVTIEDIYKYYPLTSTLTVGNIPTTLIIEGTSKKVSNIRWTLLISQDQLNAINYNTETNEPLLLAKANILGQEVILTLVVKPCRVDALSYDEGNATKTFKADKKGEVLELEFDPFEKQGYLGRFELTTNLVVHYGKIQHKFTTLLSFMGSDSDGNPVSAANIVYNYKGETSLRADENGRINVTTTLPDGQQIVLSIKFLNKTATSVIVKDGTEYTNSMPVNPYKYSGLPKQVTVNFAEGKPYTYNPTWTVPANFSIKYDTNKDFVLRAVLGDVSMTTQQIEFTLSVKPEVYNEYYLKDENSKGEKNFAIDTVWTINANYYYADPFVGRKAQLPKYILDERGKAMIEQEIVWEFEEKDINAFGTMNKDASGKYGRIINGYIKNKEVGQPVQLRVYVAAWAFENIRRPLANGSYQIMPNIEFVFSLMSGKTAYQKYQITFVVQNPKELTSIGVPTKMQKSEVFYPQDSLDVNASNSDYRLIWDETAKKAAEKNGRADGKFQLANKDYSTSEAKYNYTNSNCAYIYEQPFISQLNLGYGYGTTNNAVFVVDPLNPTFGGTKEEPYISVAEAKGRQDMLDDQKLTGKVTVNWKQGENPPTLAGSNPTIQTKYVKGGIYRGYKVIVNYKTDTYTFSQEFGVMLVFLDMSQTKNTNCEIGMSATEIPLGYDTITNTLISQYDANTYQTKPYNPYESEYNNIMIHLNTAISDGGGGMNLFQNYKQNDVYQVTYSNIAWETISDTQTKFNVYSKSFMVNGRTYYSNMLKLNVTRK